MIHYTDAILTAIFGGGVAIAVYLFFAINSVNVKMAKIETKLNIMFDVMPHNNKEAAREFFGK